MKSGTVFRWASWSIFFVALLGLGSLIALYLLGCERHAEISSSTPVAYFGKFISLFGDAAFLFLGLLILNFRPENRIGWFVLLFGLFSTYGGFFQTLGNCDQILNVGFSNSLLYIWLIDITSFLILVFFGLFLFTFPTGYFLSRRWRNASAGLFFLMSFYVIIVLVAGRFSPAVMELQQLENFVLPLFIFPLMGILSLFLRWGRSSGDERQQIKWVAFFLVIAGTLFISVEIFGTLYYPAIFEGWFYLVIAGLFIIGFPVVLSLAIFKYRLYDIDIIIRRTLVYGLVTVTLIVIYFGSVIVLQRLFTALSGQESPLVIVISTLLIAAIFNPLRSRIQELIDRRFYRKKYDRQQVLAKFAQAARDETDMETLSLQLTAVVQETMEPEQIDLWLKSG